MMEHVAPPNPSALHRPLHRFSFAHTSLTDEARVALVNGLGARSVDFRGRAQAFKFDGGRLRLKNLDLIFGSCTAAIAKKYPVFDQVRQQFAVRGSGQRRARRIIASIVMILRHPAGIETSHENGDACAQLIIGYAPALQNTWRPARNAGGSTHRTQALSSFGNPELQPAPAYRVLIAELIATAPMSCPIVGQFEQIDGIVPDHNRHNFTAC
jgi:hypothetical protein